MKSPKQKSKIKNHKTDPLIFIGTSLALLAVALSQATSRPGAPRKSIHW